MKFSRILLLVVLVSAFAGAFGVAAANALGYEDEPCPLTDPSNHQLKVCHPDAQVGKPYDLQIKGKGGCTPDFVRYDVIAGNFPPGLSVDSHSARVTGTPTQAGVYDFWLQVTDLPQSWCADSKQSQWQFRITVDPSIQIEQRQSTLGPAEVGKPFALQFTATGATGTPSWTASGSLPAGMTLNSSTGALSGTPTAIGDYSFKITATDGGRSDTQTYSLSVVAPLKVTTIAAPAAEVGVPVELNLAAEGGKGGYTWAATDLPAGLTLDPKGTISGTPTAATSADVKLTVTDAIGLKEEATYRLTVAPRVTITRRALPVAHVGRAFHARFLASGGVRGYTWSVIRGLPAGIALVDAKRASLGGTPKKAGTYRVTIQVKDKLNVTSIRTFVLKVK